MKNHGEIAEKLFREGYNCAQAVLMAFSDVTGLSKETSAQIASSFGGGLGRLREVCGAISGGAMVLGMAKGYSNPTEPSAKKAHYHLVQEFAGRFKEENGSIICRELLGSVDTVKGNDPEARTQSYYKKRPCAELVRQAADIVDQMLSK